MFNRLIIIITDTQFDPLVITVPIWTFINMYIYLHVGPFDHQHNPISHHGQIFWFSVMYLRRWPPHFIWSVKHVSTHPLCPFPLHYLVLVRSTNSFKTNYWLRKLMSYNWWKGGVQATSPTVPSHHGLRSRTIWSFPVCCRIINSQTSPIYDLIPCALTL